MAAIDRLLLECKTMDDFDLPEDDYNDIWDGKKALTAKQIDAMFWKSSTDKTLRDLLETLTAKGLEEDDAVRLIGDAFQAARYEGGN